jgi:PAS domain S-box-containing protein
MEIEFGRLVNALPGLVWTALPDGRADFVNQRWSEYTGMSLDEAMGPGWLSAVHPEDLSLLLERWAAFLASGQPGVVEGRLRRHDGVYRWFSFSAAPIADAAGEIVKWCGINTDIEERKQVEADETLLARERELKLIINTLPTTAWSTDPAGNVDFLSDRWLSYAGITAAEGAGLGWGAVIHPDDAPALFAYWQRCLDTGEPCNTEARMRRVDGEYRWFLFLANALRDETGAIVKWYGTNIDIEDRRLAEHELLRINGYLEEAQRLSLTGSFTWDVPADEHTWSAETFRIFEIEPTQKVGLEQIQARVHPDDMHQVERVIGGAADGSDFETEMRLLMPTGAVKHVFVVGHRIAQITDHPVFLGCIQDITERKRAAEELQRSEALLVEGQRLSATGSFSWRLDTDEILFSEELDRIFEFEPDRGVTFEQIFARVHPDDIALLSKQMATARAGIADHRYEIRLQMPSGAVKHVYVVGHRTEHIADGPAFIGAIRDITEQKLSEENLRRTTDHLLEAEALSKTGSATFRWATDEHYWSDELLRIWGYDVGSSITLSMVSDRVHPDDMHVFREFGERMVGRRDVAFRLQMPDGQVKYIRAVVNVFRPSPEDQPEGVAALQDVTEQWLNEQALGEVRSQLAHVARVTALGALTASIAHEVNQPLSGIITNASTCLKMLASDPPNVAGAQETARRTVRDGNRAADVIKRLRSLFARQGAAREPIDLNEAARELIALSLSDLQRRRVVVHADLADDLPLVIGDRVQLQQVILNLLLNGADAMDEVVDRSRRLTIATRREDADHVSLAVSDVGAGLGADAAERLFEAFYTTKSEGMGIGLSVSRSIVESHGGRIAVRANDGPGVTFTFTLPLRSGDAATPPEPLQRAAAADPIPFMVQR